MARPTGTRLIAAERRREIQVEGLTAEHDRRHSRGELAMAAQAYVDTARKAQAAAKGKLKLQADFWKLSPPAAWPWALSLLETRRPSSAEPSESWRADRCGDRSYFERTGVKQWLKRKLP